MATVRLHGQPAIDTARLPKVSPATKAVASFAAILFSICAFILPSPVGKVLTGVVSLGFGLVGMMPPMSAKVKIRLLAFIAAGLAMAALAFAVFGAVGADGPVVRQVSP
jgi:hypothetical protein